MFLRRLHTVRALCGPKPAFKTAASRSGRKSTFERNMPMNMRQKAWERDGMDKGDWFKKKHAHHHAKQKKTEAEWEKKHPRTSEPKKNIKQVLRELKLDPLVDYVYGTNPVLAALRSGRRSQFGKLHILHRTGKDDRLSEILALAEEMEIPVQKAEKMDLNQMTRNGVHNGVVLETRPFEVDTVKCLEKSSKETVYIDAGGFNGGEDDGEFIEIETVGAGVGEEDAEDAKFPVGIYLDEISDPHNVGAILRSAYFLGVDFVILSQRNCASLTPLVSKASSGAMEFLPIFSTEKPLKFFEESSKNGWTIVSTVAPGTGANNAIAADELKELVKSEPVLLVIGSEGEGIRKNLINRSQFVTSLEAKRPLDDSVDSLNVSVATALLLGKLLD